MTGELPRPEYPRPQFRRPEWTNLNGEWSFAFDDEDVGLAQGWQNVSAEDLRVRTRAPAEAKQNNILYVNYS